MSGWIKLHKSLKDWEWYDDHNATRLLVHLLLSVNYEDKKWKGTTIKAGSMVYSWDTLSSSCGMTIQQCRTAMDKLETSGEVTRYSTNKYQSVSLCKWEKLQKELNEVTSKLTDKQQTNNKQITTTKEYKNNKKLLDIDKFLSWFNNRKGHYTGKVGKFKTLSNTDKNNLKQLRDSYEGEDFERALRGLYASQWAKENKMHNPSHFLRVDNFNKYLDTEAEPIQEEDELTRIKRERGWIK